jgi:hypothetical protein
MTTSQKDREAIKRAIRDGKLKVKSVDQKTGAIKEKQVTDVMKHDGPAMEAKDIIRVSLVNGDEVVCTEDHSLFVMDDSFDQTIKAVEARELSSMGALVYVQGGTARPAEIASIERVRNRDCMYDISVPGPENFVLSNGVLAHNSYSIGGISLDIDKSSKYESLKSNAEDQFQKLLESKERTVKIIRGLRQSRYGVGVRSSFGPITGHGTLTPRKYLGF